jgi:methanogenic corrinoid protein MtbC1
MFRWCSYCQSLMGESAPLDDYRLTHGICPACAARMLEGEPVTAKGEVAFRSLFAAAKAGDLALCRELTDETLSLGWKPSDVAVGLIQPALYEIGRLWELGTVSTAEEHEFTSWCERALAQLEERSPDVPGPPRVVICPVDGNAHTIGARMTALFLRDRGIPARAVIGGLPDGEILDLCRRETPAVLGLSVAQNSGLARARAIAASARSLPRPPRVVVGGLAARLPEADDLERACTVEDLLRLLA